MRRSTVTNIATSRRPAPVSASSSSAFTTTSGSTPPSVIYRPRSLSKMGVPHNEVASRLFELGALPPKPPGFIAFFSPEWLFWISPGRALAPVPAFPAAEPVARVASLRCPIPSGSGRLIINHVVRGFHENAANGKNPLNLVSHVWGSPHRAALPPQEGGLPPFRIPRARSGISERRRTRGKCQDSGRLTSMLVAVP